MQTKFLYHALICTTYAIDLLDDCASLSLNPDDVENEFAHLMRETIPDLSILQSSTRRPDLETEISSLFFYSTDPALNIEILADDTDLEFLSLLKL